MDIGTQLWYRLSIQPQGHWIRFPLVFFGPTVCGCNTAWWFSFHRQYRMLHADLGARVLSKDRKGMNCSGWGEVCCMLFSHLLGVWILRLLLKWETSLLGLVAVKSLSLYFVNGFLSLSQGTCSECCQCFLDVLEKKHTFFLDTSMSWIVLRKMPSYLVEPVLSVLRNTSRLLEDFQGTSIDAWISLGLGNFASICPVLGG